MNITFFDEKQENADIKVYITNLVSQKGNTMIGFLSLDDEEITNIVHTEFPIVSSVNLGKSYNLNLNISVIKNQEFFYTCVPREMDFLARCMLGNIDGVYYEEIDIEDPTKLSLEINTKVLHDWQTGKKIKSPDSLSGSRIYEREDFKVLREILKWMEKNGFQIKKVYVDELKVVDVFTDLYMIKISLDKGYVETVKDFEIISRTGNLQKYINESKEKIDYIDLSYKNKVFYKLKSDTQNAIMSTTTATSSKI